MTVLELIAACKKRDIRLWAEDGNLHFDAPKNALTGELREQVVARKPELIALLERRDAAADDDRIRPVPREGAMPLSFSQQRMWLLEQLEDVGAAYLLPSAFRLVGDLDRDALKRALNEIVRRHEVLRSVIRDEDGKPVQVRLPETTIALTSEDLSALPEAEREAAIVRLAREEAATVFDLAVDPPFRVRLLRVGTEDHVLLATLHHIVADDWSLGILIHELGTLYTAFSQGEASPLPELPVQYADFAFWQRQRTDAGALEAQLEWWRHRLEGLPPLLELPTDRPRPPVQSYRGSVEPLTLPRDLGDRLQALGKAEGASLYMVLLGATSIWLSRYANSQDVAVGSPIANRDREELEPLIGFFVNSLVMRTQLRRGETFRELLRRIRVDTLAAYDNQQVPFETLVQELLPERVLSHAPFAQVRLMLQNAPGGQLALPGLSLRAIDQGTEVVKFDLLLSFSESETGLSGALQYATDLFERETIQRWLTHLGVLLAGIADAPDGPVDDLPILTAGERAALLETWNETDRAYPAEKAFHQLFSEQAAQNPARTAVLDDQESMSYGWLEQRSNRLAHLIQSRDPGGRGVVALIMPRCADAATVILAAGKAGRAYMAIDPELPAARIEQILTDADPAVVVSRQGLASDWPLAEGQLIDLDFDWAELEQKPDRAPTFAPPAIAYLIYTSGSTGTPKGVSVGQRALVNYVVGVMGRLDLAEDARMAALSTLAADLGHTAWFGALGTGRTLVLPPEPLSLEPDELADWLTAEPVDCLKIVPSHLTVLLTARNPEKILPRRLLVLGGEAADPDLITRVRTLRPECRIVNHYGPCEATVGVCTHELPANWSADGQPIPLAAPLPNSRLYVVSPSLQPAPEGIPGELVIAGDGLAFGYHGRPATTAAAFVPDPFCSGDQAHGRRLYRTGDKVRRASDGRIIFLGRIDHQLEIRGFRVEPGEIATLLCTHPFIAEAVVVARADGRGDLQLVAYLQGSEQLAALDDLPGDLRSFLGMLLPEYMIPARFLVLEAMPRNANGKLDRKALPDPEHEAPKEVAFVAPRSESERVLAEIWSDVLDRDKVGVHDHFFKLGGHSLLATLVIARIRNHFSLPIEVRALYDHPTVEALAEFIDTQLWATAGPVTTGSDDQVEEGEL